MTHVPLTPDLAARAVIAAADHFGFDLDRVLSASSTSSYRAAYVVAAQALAYLTGRPVSRLTVMFGSARSSPAGARRQNRDRFDAAVTAVRKALASTAPASTVRASTPARQHASTPDKTPRVPARQAFDPSKLSRRPTPAPELRIEAVDRSPEAVDDRPLVEAVMAQGGFSRVEGDRLVRADGSPLERRR